MIDSQDMDFFAEKWHENLEVELSDDGDNDEDID